MSVTIKQASPAGRRHNVLRPTAKDKVFYAVNGLLLAIFLLLVIIPILYVFANAFSDSDSVAAGKVTFWPMVRNAQKQYNLGVSVDGFTSAFKNDSIISGYLNTLYYTFFGTLINVVLTLLAAYPLSRSDLPGRNKIMMLFAFTMIFNGGLIPNYMLMRELDFINTRWAMLLPLAINVYNMVICRTFFQHTIPKELQEAAELDGSSDARFFVSIVLPLSKAILAVIALYYAVFHWNAYFNAFLYLTDKRLYPLQIVLKDIMIANTVTASMLEGAATGDIDYNIILVLKYSLILVACLPIWCLYPFVQKYFVQGVMIGSVKG